MTWIAVTYATGEWPEDGEPVLVVLDGYIAIASVLEGVWWYDDEDLAGLPEYWMPLPELP